MLRTFIALALLGSILPVHAEEADVNKTPGFALRSLGGEYVFLSNYCETANQGTKRVKEPSVVVVNFMASWCGPCLTEMPLFVELHNQYKDQNLKVFLISEDKMADKAKLQARVKNLPKDLPVLLDPFQVAAKNFGAIKDGQVEIPYTLVITPNGEIIVNHKGVVKKGDPLFKQVANQVAKINGK